MTLKKRLFSSSRTSKRLSWTVPTGSITSHTPLTNPAPSMRVDTSLVVARSRRCDRRPIVYGPVCVHLDRQDCNPHVHNRVGTGTCECMEHFKRCTHESRASPATNSAELWESNLVMTYKCEVLRGHVDDTKSVSFRLLGRVRGFHGRYRPDLSPHTLH